MASKTPVIAEMQVVPVAGRDGMLLNLSVRTGHISPGTSLS